MKSRPFKILGPAFGRGHRIGGCRADCRGSPKPSPRFIAFSNSTLNPIEPIWIIAVLKLNHHPAKIAVDGEPSP